MDTTLFRAMDSFEVNTIKAEKGEAMRGYNCQKRFKKICFFVEGFTALAVLSWSSYTYIRVAAETVSEFLRHYVDVLAKPLYVFCIINVLIAIISVLSSQKPTKTDFYDKYVTVTTTTNVPRRSFDDSPAEQSPTAEDKVIDKQIVCVDNAVHNSPVEKNRFDAIAVNDCQPKRTPSPVQQKKFEAINERKNFRRTRSERLGKANRRELQRSETVINRDASARRSYEMDDLSSEDFRKAIETFIASKKKTLIQENTLDLKLEEKWCMAITLASRN